MPEHSIHPEPRKDPWELEFQPDNGYKFQIVKGVYQVRSESNHLVDVAVFILVCDQVYRSQEDLLSRAKKPINYEVRF